MSSTIGAKNDTAVELQSEFDRFVAIVSETPYTPFPIEELQARRRKQQSMRNSNRIEGVAGGPISDRMLDYLLTRRVPSDEAAIMLVRFHSQQ